MRTGSALAVILLAMPAMSQETTAGGASRDCIGQPVTCVTAILGSPSEQRDSADMLEYRELSTKYGPYFFNTPQGDVRYSGYVPDKKGGVMKDTKAYYFHQPLIYPNNGAPFRVACDFTVIFMPKADRVVISGNNCTCMQAPLHLTDLARGDDKGCRIAADSDQ